MTIAFTFEIFLPVVNGVITVTSSIASVLSDQGHKVIFIIPRMHNSPTVVSDKRILILSVPSIHSFLYPGLRLVAPFSSLLRQYLIGEKVNILHITGPGSLSYAALRVARKLCIPIVHTWHTMLSDPGYLRMAVFFPPLIPIIQSMATYYYRPFVRNVTMTAPGAAAKDFLQSLSSIPYVHSIRNGIDLARLKSYDSFQKLQAQYPLFNRKTFVFIGRVSVEKAINVLIYIFKRVIRKDPDIRLFVIGEGPQLYKMQKLTAMLSLSNIVFTGALKHHDVLQKGFLQHARAFVTSSTSEAQSMVQIESLAAGTPIIAFNDSANKDVVGDAGILVKENDIQAFEHACIKITHDAALWKSLKEKALQRSMLFDIRVVTQQIINIYQSLYSEE